MPIGVIGGTGIAGLTLGGGVGWLTHSDGLTIDHLVAAEVVTAAGEHLHVDEETNPDLLWGLRGGGGNFAVVTSFTFRARPLASPVLGGNLVYHRPGWRNALQALSSWTAGAIPDDMNVIATFMRPPPLLELGDEPVLIIGFAWASPDHEAGRTLVTALTEQAPPDLEDVGPVPWIEWQTAMDPVFPKGSRGYWKNVSFSGLDDEVIDVLVSHAGEVTWQGTGIDIHHMGGAFARVPQDATAFPNRSARYWLNIYGFWQDPADDERLSAFARRLHAAMQPFAEQGEYVNFLGAEDGSRDRPAGSAVVRGVHPPASRGAQEPLRPGEHAPRQPQHRPHRLSRLAGGTHRAHGCAGTVHTAVRGPGRATRAVSPGNPTAGHGARPPGAAAAGSGGRRTTTGS